jgi:hypothetical protein
LDSGHLGHEGQAARRWICVDWLIGAARDEERQVLARLHIAATAKLAAVPIAPSAAYAKGAGMALRIPNIR